MAETSEYYDPAAATEEWSAYVDESSGDTYYYNNVTCETRWDDPYAAAAEKAYAEEVPAEHDVEMSVAPTNEDAALDPADDPSAWETAEDPNGYGTYYYNNITQATQWEPPACLHVTTPEVEAVTDSAVAKEEADDENEQGDPDTFPDAAAEEETVGANASRGSSIISEKTPNSSILSAKSPNNSINEQKPMTLGALGSPSMVRSSSASGSMRKQYKSSVLVVDSSRSNSFNTGGSMRNNSYRHNSMSHIDEDDYEEETVESYDQTASRIVEEAPDLSQKLILSMTEFSMNNSIVSNNTEAHADYVGNIVSLTEPFAFSYYAYKNFKLPDGVAVNDMNVQNGGFDANGKPVSAATLQEQKRKATDRLLSWQQELLKTAVLKSVQNQGGNELVAEATYIFRQVTSFMRDRMATASSSRETDRDFAYSILENLLVAPSPVIYDEVYCQICKQLHNNPNIASTVRGWQLLNICLASFPPSPELAPFLINFAAQNMSSVGDGDGNRGRTRTVSTGMVERSSSPADENSTNAIIAKLATSIVYNTPIALRLHKNRRELPCNMELEALENGELMNIRVYFVDGKYVMMPISSWLTAADVEHEITEYRLHMAHFPKLTEDAALFALYETTGVLVQGQSHSTATAGRPKRSQTIQGMVSPGSGSGMGSGNTAPANTTEVVEIDSRALETAERIVDVLSLWQHSAVDQAQFLPEEEEGENSSVTHHKSKAKHKHHHNHTHANANLPIYKFVYKRKHYFDATVLSAAYGADMSTIELTYYEVIKDVLAGYYPYAASDAYLLAAMQLQHDYGDFDAAKEFTYFRYVTASTDLFGAVSNSADVNSNGAQSGQAGSSTNTGGANAATSVSSGASSLLMGSSLQSNFNANSAPISVSLLEQYVSKCFLYPAEDDAEAQANVSSKLVTDQEKFAKLEGYIMTNYKKLVGLSRFDVRLMYLDYVRSWKLFGARYFLVEPQKSASGGSNSESDGNSAQTQVILAINFKGVTLLDPVTKDFLTEYSYSSIISWGYSLNSVVLIIGVTTAKQVKLYFKTNEGKYINELVDMHSKQCKAVPN